LSSFKDSSYGDTCPIAAQAAGQGALALVRTSGQGVLEQLANVFSRPQALLDAKGFTVIHGWIQDKGAEKIDEVLISIYRAPKSFTGEDAADISCHGGTAAVKAVLETLLAVGFREALPGEFTFRAFMNGKIDLTRSESVMEMVAAKTRQGLGRAAGRLAGALEREISAIRNMLLEIVSAVELYLDYSEDELGAADTVEEGMLPNREAAEDALEKLRTLALSYRRERLYQEGSLAVIAGRPNAGKSSLFNALLNEDRSIVTEIPGTTRDWIEGSISLEGIPLRLADTAGLRDPGEPGAAVEAEARGIERSRELIEEADIILYVVDGIEGINGEDETFLQDHGDRPLLLLWNKADVKEAAAGIHGKFPDLLTVSAKTGSGMEALCASILHNITGTIAPVEAPGSGLGTIRQKDLIDRAILALEEALKMADRKEVLDLIAPVLRESLDALGEITGEVSSADILETMFSRFCLGK
jgi:tRNA modification GTPase